MLQKHKIMNSRVRYLSFYECVQPHDLNRKLVSLISDLKVPKYVVFQHLVRSDPVLTCIMMTLKLVFNCDCIQHTNIMLISLLKNSEKIIYFLLKVQNPVQSEKSGMHQDFERQAFEGHRCASGARLLHDKIRSF